jgi:hypothetical protein
MQPRIKATLTARHDMLRAVKGLLPLFNTTDPANLPNVGIIIFSTIMEYSKRKNTLVHSVIPTSEMREVECFGGVTVVGLLCLFLVLYS